MITIRNIKRGRPKKEWEVYVDRTSILGNPIYMKNESQRDRVCDLYQVLFDFKVWENDYSYIKELERLKRIYKKCGK